QAKLVQVKGMRGIRTLPRWKSKTGTERRICPAEGDIRNDPAGPIGTSWDVPRDGSKVQNHPYLPSRGRWDGYLPLRPLTPPTPPAPNRLSRSRTAAGPAQVII